MPARPPRVKLSFRQKAKRQTLRLLVILPTLYVVIILMLAVFQDKLVFPGASSQGTPDAILSPPVASQLVHLQAADGTPLTALYATSLHNASNPLEPTILFFYGNAMCMADAADLLNTFRRPGSNVMLIDYEGYGMSGGKPSEKGCYAAADAAFQYLLDRPDASRHRIIIAGWSLGAAVAIDLASRHPDNPHIAAVIACSAFTSLTDTARFHFPIFPVSLVLHSRFNSLAKIPAIHVPILLAHGRRDDIVPFPMRDRLAAAATAPVTTLTLDDASHNDFFDADEDTLTTALQKFLTPFTTPAP